MPDRAFIFSLEIQFGNIEFNQDFEDVLSVTPGVLSVRTRVLNLPIIEINENEFCNNCNQIGEIDLSKGKYILLPIPEADIKQLSSNFIIHINIMVTRLQDNLLPLMTQIGYSKINIGRTFAQLVPNNIEKNCPLIKLLKDQLDIVDLETGSILGTICVYLRLKSYGRFIVADKEESVHNMVDENFDLFKKCYDKIEDVADIYPSILEKHSDDVNKQTYKEVNAVTSDIALGVKIFKSEPKMKTDITSKSADLKGKPLSKCTKKDKQLDPGSVYLGENEVIFKMDGSGMPTSEANPKITYGMKSDMYDHNNVTNNQIQMIPNPELIKGSKDLHQTVDNFNNDVYAIRISKKSSKKNVFAMLEMEVRVPRVMKETKERFNKDVQYSLADIAPPAPAAAAGGKKKK